MTISFYLYKSVSGEMIAWIAHLSQDDYLGQRISIINFYLFIYLKIFFFLLIILFIHHSL